MAAHMGPCEHPYDHLIEHYDPGVTTAWLRATFARMTDALNPRIDKLSADTTPLPPLAKASTRAIISENHRC
jgi:Zn-dependent M32 family carboxypeptidase